MIAVHGAISRRVEHLLTLTGRDIAQRAEGATHLLFARRIHVAELLCGAAHRLPALRAEALHVLDTAESALALLRWHGVELMEAIDEALLLLLGQAVESRLAAEGVFLADEGFSLMTLEPVAEVLATRVRVGGAGVGSAWPGSVAGRACAIRGTRSGRGRSGGTGCGLARGRRWMRASTAAMLCVHQRQYGERDRKQKDCRTGECTCRGDTATVRPDACAGRAIVPSCS